MAGKTTALGLRKPAPGHEVTFAGAHNANMDKMAAKLGTTRVVVPLGLDLATGDRIAWAPRHACHVTAIGLISQTTTVSPDASNKYVVNARNVTKGETVASINTDTGSELTADTITPMVMGAASVLDLAANDILEIQATKTGTPTDLAAAQIAAVIDYYIDE